MGPELNKTGTYQKNFIDPNQYITDPMCTVRQSNRVFRFKKAECRLCVYLQRYRIKI